MDLYSLTPKLHVMRFLFLLVSLFCAFAFSGCETTHFGVREDVWLTLTPEQQDKAINAYHANQAARNEIRKADAQRKLEEQRFKNEQLLQEKDAAIQQARRIKVAFRESRLRYESQTYRLNECSIELTHGKTRLLHLANTIAPNETIPLPIAYTRGRLVIGQNVHDSEECIEIPFESRWKSGESYRMERLPIRSPFSGNVSFRITALD